MAKIYPEPYKRKSGYYYFKYVSREGKRVEKSTGAKTKERARLEIQRFVDSLTAVASISFRDYAAPFFIWPTCPRTSRLLDEGKQIGRAYVQGTRRLLVSYVFTDPVFPFQSTRPRGARPALH